MPVAVFGKVTLPASQVQARGGVIAIVTAPLLRFGLVCSGGLGRSGVVTTSETSA
jgi:hypothetical protein